MTITRRELAKGTAWAAPAIVAASAAPAYAASPSKIDVRFYNPLGCRGPGRDAYAYVNLTNSSSTDITLTSPLVLSVQISNPNRSRTAPSSNVGTQSCRDGSGTLTGCVDVLWTIPSGTVFRAGTTIDMVWHLLVDLGDGAHLIVNQISGGNVLSNPSTSSTTQGYTGLGGCLPYDDF